MMNLIIDRSNPTTITLCKITSIIGLILNDFVSVED